MAIHQLNWQNFLVEVDDKIAIITISRLPSNTLSFATITELNQLLDELEKDNNVRVIIITGKDREDKPERSIFSAGAEINELFDELLPKDVNEIYKILERNQSTLTRIENFTKPVIACINGHALGGGCELAIVCHLRIMADTATIGVPEVTLGLLPGYGGTSRLPRFLPRTKALEMLLTGVRLSAQEALLINLVNKVVKKGEEMNVAKEYAKMLATRSGPIAMSEIIKIVSKSDEVTLKESLKMEQAAFEKLLRTKDAKEGSMAFFQKRLPEFKGE